MTSSSNVLSAGAPHARAGWARWLAIGWLIAATCDICYATGFSYLYRGVPPSRILKLVASGFEIAQWDVDRNCHLGADATAAGELVARLG